jgi:hypothetical protein
VFPGSLILSERVGWNRPTGALVVVLSILISQERLPAARGLLTAVPATGDD